MKKYLMQENEIVVLCSYCTAQSLVFLSDLVDSMDEKGRVDKFTSLVEKLVRLHLEGKATVDG